MLGLPPDILIDGQHGRKYFRKVRSKEGGWEDKGGAKETSLEGPAAQKDGSTADGTDAPKAAATTATATAVLRQAGASTKYSLKTAEEYAAETNTEVPALKKYLRYSRLDEVIMKCPLANKAKLTAEQKSHEMQRRMCFLHFLQGLFVLNPFERWTPRQAAGHPFITNAPFQSSFRPAVDPKVNERKLAYLIDRQQKQQKAAAAAAAAGAAVSSGYSKVGTYGGMVGARHVPLSNFRGGVSNPRQGFVPLEHSARRMSEPLDLAACRDALEATTPPAPLAAPSKPAPADPAAAEGSNSQSSSHFARPHIPISDAPRPQLRRGNPVHERPHQGSRSAALPIPVQASSPPHPSAPAHPHYASPPVHQQQHLRRGQHVYSPHRQLYGRGNPGNAGGHRQDSPHYHPHDGSPSYAPQSYPMPMQPMPMQPMPMPMPMPPGAVLIMPPQFQPGVVYSPVPPALVYSSNYQSIDPSNMSPQSYGAAYAGSMQDYPGAYMSDFGQALLRPEMDEHRRLRSTQYYHTQDPNPNPSTQYYHTQDYPDASTSVYYQVPMVYYQHLDEHHQAQLGHTAEYPSPQHQAHMYPMSIPKAIPAHMRAQQFAGMGGAARSYESKGRMNGGHRQQRQQHQQQHQQQQQQHQRHHQYQHQQQQQQQQEQYSGGPGQLSHLRRHRAQYESAPQQQDERLGLGLGLGLGSAPHQQDERLPSDRGEGPNAKVDHNGQPATLRAPEVAKEEDEENENEKEEEEEEEGEDTVRAKANP